MKIAMIDEDLSPRTGSRRFTYEVTHRLNRLGHEVKIFTTALNEENCFEEYLSMPIEVVSDKKSYRRDAPRGLKRIKKNAFFEIVNDVAYWSKQARLALQISKKVADEQCDVALFQYHGEHWLLPYFYHLNAPNGVVYLNVVPPLARPRALPFQELTLTKRLANALVDLPPVGNWENSSFQRLGLLITPSQFQLEQATRQGFIGLRKATVVPLGVNHSKFYPTGEEQPFALYLGRLHPHKSLELALLSMKDTPSDYSLIFAGDIEEPNLWYKEKLLSMAEELGLSSRFRIVLHPSESQMVRFLQQCCVFLFPSTIDTFGLVVLEAMACGKPIVACRRGGVPEVLGGAGFLLSPDVTQWRNAVSRLLKDASLRRELGKRALERSKLFSWEKTTDKLLSSFSQVAA